MGDRQNYIVSEIVKYSQKLDQKGFGANHDGNISTKFEDVLLATPTAVSKGNIVPEIVITLDQEGKKISGVGKPFSEIKLHLAAYNSRPETRAVVHAHPPFATARGLTNKPLEPQLPEAVVSIGNFIPVAEFAMPGTQESEQFLISALMQADVVMLPGNGVLAIGDNVEMAYLRLELVEHLAKIYFYADTMGQSLQLPTTATDKLLQKRASLGLGPQNQTAVASPAQPSEQQLETIIKNIVSAEINKFNK